MPSRPELYDALLDAIRESASRTLMLHQAVADRFQLNSTDLKALDLARHETGLTAGRLAELTGLRTSSITAVLDRLERRGMIERRPDPADRRKVVVVATGADVPHNQGIFAALADEVRAILDDYPDAQLGAFLELYRRLNTMADAQVRAITDQPSSPARRAR